MVRLIEAVPAERARRIRRRQLQRTVYLGLLGSLSIAAGTWVWLGASSGDALGPPAEAGKLQLVYGQLAQRHGPLAAGVEYTIATLGRLKTPRTSGARFVTNEGVRVDVAASSMTDLNFSEHQRSIALLRGKVSLSVPRLGRDTSLAVTTPDAVITVHGTRFSVEYRNDQTCIQVTEGIVSVARGAEFETLVAGRQSGCAQPIEVSAPSAAVREAEQAPVVKPDHARKNAGAPRHASMAHAGGGTLTAENRLFERILAAEQAQRWRQAEQLAKRLLARYPDSPMAPETRRVLGRVTAQLGKAGAKGQ